MSDKTSNLNDFVIDFFSNDKKAGIYNKSAAFIGRTMTSYSTIIAKFISERELILNSKYYSNTTSRLQNTIRRIAPKWGIKVVEMECEPSI